MPREFTLGEVRYLLRTVEPEDAPDVVALFTRVFGAPPPEGWYAWKYGAEGLQGRAVGLWDENGRLFAHYGGTPRHLLWHGKPVAAVQIGDVMVAPEARGLLSRRGPFFQVCSAFFGQWVGGGKPFALAFGFPNVRHLRLGVKLGLYHDLGAITTAQWGAGKNRLPFGWRAVEIDVRTPEFDRIIERAWRQQAEEGKDRILGGRDPDYVRRRYALRPGVTHHYIACRRWGTGSTAVAIVRQEGETLRWLDFIGPSKRLSATAGAVRLFADKLGATVVETWASSASALDLHRAGAAIGPEAARFALARASLCQADVLTRDGWWLAGDTDFL